MTLDEETNKTDWQTLAWNGITVSTPADWDIASIGRQYLLLANPEGPCLEIKWGAVRGRFSHRAQRRRIAAGGRSGKPISVKETELPEQWRTALSGFHTSGFVWEDQTATGHGLILHCSKCRQATLIQFLLSKKAGSSTGVSHDIQRRLLQSFRDHSDSPMQLLSIYDIRGRLPRDFKLQRYRFSPGNFTITLARPSATVTLYRWGLASLSLQHKTLRQFGEEHISMTRTATRKREDALGSRMHWRHSVNSWMARLTCRLNRSFPVQGVTLWHLPEEDRILGVQAAGKTSAIHDLENTIVENYGIVSSPQ